MKGHFCLYSVGNELCNESAKLLWFLTHSHTKKTIPLLNIEQKKIIASIKESPDYCVTTLCHVTGCKCKVSAKYSLALRYECVDVQPELYRS